MKWLKVRLTRRAQTAFQCLLAKDLGDFYKAITALQEWFEPPFKKHRSEAELQTHPKVKGETWVDFTDDLISLADKAYPELEEASWDRIVLNIHLSQLDNPLVAFGV